MFLYEQCIFELAVLGTHLPVYSQSSEPGWMWRCLWEQGWHRRFDSRAWGPLRREGACFPGSYQDDMPFILKGLELSLLYIYQALSEFYLVIIFFILPRSLLGLNFHLHG